MTFTNNDDPGAKNILCAKLQMIHQHHCWLNMWDREHQIHRIWTKWQVCLHGVVVQAQSIIPRHPSIYCISAVITARLAFTATLTQSSAFNRKLSVVHCTADKECTSFNYLPNQTCGVDPSNPHTRNKGKHPLHVISLIMDNDNNVKKLGSTLHFKKKDQLAMCYLKSISSLLTHLAVCLSTILLMLFILAPTIWLQKESTRI